MLVCVQITIEAIESDTDEIALQGIEFWSTVCDEEVDLAIELSEVSGLLYMYLNSSIVVNRLICSHAELLIGQCRGVYFGVFKKKNSLNYQKLLNHLCCAGVLYMLMQDTV